MIRHMVQKHGLYFDIFFLSIIVIVPPVVWCFFGWPAGGVSLVLLVFFLDGLAALWGVLTYSWRRNFAKEEDRLERKRFRRNTKNNPTIR